MDLDHGVLKYSRSTQAQFAAPRALIIVMGALISIGEIIHHGLGAAHFALLVLYVPLEPHPLNGACIYDDRRNIDVIAIVLVVIYVIEALFNQTLAGMFKIFVTAVIDQYLLLLFLLAPLTAVGPAIPHT